MLREDDLVPIAEPPQRGAANGAGTTLHAISDLLQDRVHVPRAHAVLIAAVQIMDVIQHTAPSQLSDAHDWARDQHHEANE